VTISEEQEILRRLDDLMHTTALEARAVAAELAALRAEMREGFAELRQAIRDLWTEHLGHSHPTGP
jgi:hypothetical protein